MTETLLNFSFNFSDKFRLISLSSIRQSMLSMSNWSSVFSLRSSEDVQVIEYFESGSVFLIKEQISDLGHNI